MRRTMMLLGAVGVSGAAAGLLFARHLPTRIAAHLGLVPLETTIADVTVVDATAATPQFDATPLEITAVPDAAGSTRFGVRVVMHSEFDPVDHQRQHGVPPAGNDDYEDALDAELAASFPASDPPGHW